MGPLTNALKKNQSHPTYVLTMNLTAKCAFYGANIKKFLSENYPLLSVLAGFFLVSLSIGPYQNGDTTWEFDAVSGVTKYGLPYANGLTLMNQPPLGFYIQAGFGGVFGLSVNNGTFLVTLFGLASVVLVYGIGKTLYNKTTGFFAALLFAFSPWHLVMSRTFLIDAQCLFFSLLFLYTGLLAVKRSSLKLFAVSGIIFAAAVSTKLYAVFALLPHMLFFFYLNGKNLKRYAVWLPAFFLPVLVASFLWYQTITGLGLASVFSHGDLVEQSAAGVVYSVFFVPNLLTNYTLGWFFFDAAILSLLVCFAQRRLLQKYLVADVVWLVAIVCVVAVNVYLGVTLNLKSPYLNGLKFDYQLLPFFSLLAASLVTKCISLFNASKSRLRAGKLAFFVVAVVGLVLVAGALLVNMAYEHSISTSGFLIFRVAPNVNLGYSLFNYAPIGANSLLMDLQYVGFAVALSGLLWFSRHRLISALKYFRKN
jgi:4-amino-4-deoxy-L-arabinose transferase-like glycosyltransferase